MAGTPQAAKVLLWIAFVCLLAHLTKVHFLYIPGKDNTCVTPFVWFEPRIDKWFSVSLPAQQLQMAGVRADVEFLLGSQCLNL